MGHSLGLGAPPSASPGDTSHPHEPGCRVEGRGPRSCGSSPSQLFFPRVLADSVVLWLYLEDSLRKAVEASAHRGQLGHLEMGVFICSGRVACGKEGSEVTGALCRTYHWLYLKWWLRVPGPDPERLFTIDVKTRGNHALTMDHTPGECHSPPGTCTPALLGT